MFVHKGPLREIKTFGEAKHIKRINDKKLNEVLSIY